MFPSLWPQRPPLIKHSAPTSSRPSNYYHKLSKYFNLKNIILLNILIKNIPILLWNDPVMKISFMNILVKQQVGRQESHTVLHDIISNCSSAFHSQSLNISSPHCLSYISHDLSYESLVLIRQNSLVIPSFFSLLFCLRMFCFRKQNRYSFLVILWSGMVKKDNLIESWGKDRVRKPSFI